MASDSDSDSDFEQQVTQVPKAPKLGSRRLLSPTTSEPEDNSPEPPRAPRMGSRRLVHSTSMNDLPHTSTDDDFSSSSSSDNVPPPAPRINTRSLSNRSLRSDCSSDSFVSASSHGSPREFCLSRASSTASLATGDDVFEPVSPPQAPKDSLSPDASARDADSDSLSSSLDSSAHSGALFMNIAPGGPSVLALPPSPSQAPGSSLIVNLPPHTSPSSPLHNLPLRPSSHRFSRNAFHQL